MVKLNAENLLAAAGLSLAASVLVPLLRDLSKTRSGDTVAAGLGVSDRARKGWSCVQEEMEDFLAEVQFKRLSNKIHREGGPSS
ncbi:hypothetical protein GCM10025857_31060 [Alicyclobacillus contaminans]|uniref:hypothetical protein n=1 Tax=Alicyclobacillus contaminans TaxID=392016 RepID=UPI0004298F25|nr:hypothetical protein [Alicyclobacillus contaminans]GMA51749.1 hypothetical protein GCM10025857_31060 [Alicyclobacillus contaminans]